MLARQNAQLAAIQLQSLVHCNERDATAWMLEWENLPRMIRNTGTALRHALRISKTIGVDREAMQTNLTRPDQGH
jgi:adenylosuccinate lyase